MEWVAARKASRPLIRIGPALVLLGMGRLLGAAPPDTPPGSPQNPARVAAIEHSTLGADRIHGTNAVAEEDPTSRARKAISDCKIRFRPVQDYSCTFFKRERIGGKMSSMNIMSMKVRTHPRSIYIKFIQPNEGREAIWVDGRNKGKVVAHEPGITKLVAGTMHLDPRGEMAMEENRHPITEAGIGSLIEKVASTWETGLVPGVTKVVFHPSAKVGDRACTMIETIHNPAERCDFSRVCLYIDVDLGLPIRIESYGWPKKPGLERELVEEYTYANLKINSGLKERDFDPNNPQYSYGRF